MKIRANISLSKDLSENGLVVGMTGSGKSSFALNLIYQLVRKSNGDRRHAVIVLDPHGDMGRTCVMFANNDRQRLYYLSTAINREAETKQDVTCVFNPFVSDGSKEMRYLLTETLTESLKELLVDANLTTQMLTILRPCIATVLRLSGDRTPSITELNRFFLEGHNADLVELGKTSEIEQHRTFFTYEWHNENLRVSKNSLRVKLSFFLSDPRVASFLNGTPTYSLEKALNEGAFTVLNLPEGSGVFASKIIGKLFIAYLHAVMMRRDAIDPKKRKKCYLIVDEFHSMVTASLANSLATTRKYGLSCILLSQSLLQVPDTTIRKTIMVNAGFKAVGITDHQDRSSFAKEMGIDTTELEKLRKRQFYFKRNDGRKPAIKITAPILSQAFQLTSKERKALFQWFVYDSGQYVPVPPPPAIPPPPAFSSAPNKGKTTPSKATDTDEGLKPAF